MFSDRLFRAQKLSRAASFQPRLRAQANWPLFSTYAEVFGHFSDNGSDHDPRTEEEFDGSHTTHFAELGYDVGISKTIEVVTLRAGHRWYSYDQRTARLDNTAEFFGRVQLETLAHPYLEADYDWDAHRGAYGELGLEQPVPIDIPHRRVQLTPFAILSASAGLADRPMPIYADNGLVAFETGVRADVLIADMISIQPSLRYTSAIDENADSLFTAGVRLTGRFGVP